MHLRYLFPQALISNPFRQEAVRSLLAMMGESLQVGIKGHGDETESQVCVIASLILHLLNGRYSIRI